MKGNRHLFAVASALLAVLVACGSAGSAAPDAPTPALPSPSRQAADVAKAFVSALNQPDYSAAFALLDVGSQQALRDAESLRNEYVAAETVMGVQGSVAQLRGVLQEGNEASAALVTTWGQNSLTGWVITTTLPLTVTGEQWRVRWSRDAIVPGLASGALSFERIAIPRGAILAADGSVLADQTERSTLGVQRGEISGAAEEAAMLDLLSRVTGLPIADIKARYENQPADWFIPIADISNEAFQENEAAFERFQAIIARNSLVRHYPQPQVAPHLVGWLGAISPDALEQYRQRGYSGDEQVGVNGIEAAADEALAGSVGGRLLLRNADGAVSIVAQRPFERSKDVTLSISPTLQVAVQHILGERAGAAIVMNIKDGGILAMASYPTFDPLVFVQPDETGQRERLLNAPDKPLLNRAVQSIYPPGSAFKMVTMAAGLHEGVAGADDVFTDPGSWDGLGEALRRYCWNRRGHGQLSFVQGLSASCNVVFYTVGKSLDQKGQDLLPQYARQFGFGARTGIEISGEATGLVPDAAWKLKNQGDGWATGDTVNMAIGQGFVLVTPLQVARMTAAIANGGTLVRPHLIAKIGDVAYAPTEPAPRLPINNAELSAIQAGMRGVIEDAKFGTAHFRFSTLEAYLLADGRVALGSSLTAEQRNNAIKLSIAGKSGTAQTGDAQAKPYAWFTAYVPADDPQIAITVLLENIGEGSVYAAPAVRQIIEAYYGLPLSATPTDTRVSD